MKLTPACCAIHTHNTMCDGKASPRDMAEAAFRAGVRYFGVSCHSHTPIPIDEGAVLPADMTEYMQTVLSLREEYEGRMEVLLGLEWDSCSDIVPPGELDYWIGSVHYQRGNGTWYCADWGEEAFAACREELWNGDALGVAEGFFGEAAALAAKKPPVLAHFDLITKLNAGNRFFDEEASRYRKAALDALHAADPKESLLEINTGGVARGYRKLPYPALFLLKEWKQMGGKIILSSDAHNTDTILFGYQEAAELAKAAGFDRSTILTRKGRQECLF